jgi:glycosyltransferase involved in cell wall biosynthesis
MALSCFYGLEGGCLEWNGIRCYPTDITRFGAMLLGEYAANHCGGDRSKALVFTLQDLWPLLPGVPNLQGLRFCNWTPVDHDPLPPQVGQFLSSVDSRVVAMSRHGQRMLQDAGFDALYVPHAVDTAVFKPQHAVRAELREALKIPVDAFVVGMVGNNQGLPSRKSFPQVFRAFAEFSKRHSDAVLYVHGDVMGRNNGVNLIQLGQACGIDPDKMRTSDQLSLHLGIPQAVVANVFSTFDVLAMPSMGEGFGIPLIESQAAGVPVITTDWTAMTELCGSGWLVDGDPWWDQGQGAYQKAPFIGEILDAMEEAYTHAGSQELLEKAVAFAAGYDVNRVMEEMWLPVLAEVTRPREVEPLRVAA